MIVVKAFYAGKTGVHLINGEHDLHITENKNPSSSMSNERKLHAIKILFLVFFFFKSFQLAYKLGLILSTPITQSSSAIIIIKRGNTTLQN